MLAAFTKTCCGKAPSVYSFARFAIGNLPEGHFGIETICYVETWLSDSRVALAHNRLTV